MIDLNKINGACTFSMEHYGQMLDFAVESEYQIGPLHKYEELSAAKKSILLRHDVDVSLELAYEMALFENERGVESTFFIRLHSKYYDPAQPNSKTLIKDIANIAEVGLHYEVGYYHQNGGDITNLIKKDMEQFVSITGLENFGGAAHMTSRVGGLTEDELLSSGLAYEAYASAISERYKYISDSASRWREGCLCNWLGDIEKLHVLIHPVWWLNWIEEDAIVIERLRSGD